MALLINGEDLRTTTEPDFVGFDPDDILTTSHPLLPVDLPRRVALLKCGCLEAGCGAVAPIISTRPDGNIAWSAFKYYGGGEFEGPTSEEVDPRGGQDLARPEVVFEAGEYVAEVQRATADLSWESNGPITRRLFGERLREHPDLLIEGGFRPDRGGLHWYGDEVAEIWLHPAAWRGYPARVLEVPVPSGLPQDRAAAVLDLLRAVPPGEWLTRFGSPRYEHTSAIQFSREEDDAADS